MNNTTLLKIKSITILRYFKLKFISFTYSWDYFEGFRMKNLNHKAFESWENRNGSKLTTSLVQTHFKFIRRGDLWIKSTISQCHNNGKSETMQIERDKKKKAKRKKQDELAEKRSRWTDCRTLIHHHHHRVEFVRSLIARHYRSYLYGAFRIIQLAFISKWKKNIQHDAIKPAYLPRRLARHYIILYYGCGSTVRKRTIVSKVSVESAHAKCVQKLQIKLSDTSRQIIKTFR